LFSVHVGEAAFADPEGQHPRDADQTWEMARAVARNLMNTAFEQPINGAASPIARSGARAELYTAARSVAS
jgi:hypothetical protein